MAKRRWTVVLVPHGSEPSRIVEVSYGVLKLAGRRRCAGIVGRRCSSGTATISRTADLSRTARLEQENAPLGSRDRRAARPARPPSPTPSPGSPSVTPASGSWPISIPSIPRSRRPASAAHAGAPPDARRTTARPCGSRAEEIRVDLNALIRRANLLASSFEEAADSLASPLRASRGHAVHHADAGLAHQRVLVDARASDPAHRPAARGHRRDRADGQPDRGARRRRASLDAGWETGLRQHHHHRPRVRHRHQVRPRVQAAGQERASASTAASGSPWSAIPASPPARTCTTRCT